MITPDVPRYTTGTLTYDRRGLVRLFFWLLLGDFTMSVTLTCLPKLLPLQLDLIGIQPSAMGWLLSLGPLASLIISPFIGVWSDRLRTSWGRRRPFLLISTPVLALGLVLIPHLHHYTLLCIVIFIVQIANVLETVLFYLYADIIPPELMGRFMAGFRLVGILGVLAFQYFLMPLFGSSPTLVWTICGAAYFVLYQLSLLFVREGSYPPPKNEPVLQVVRDYVKDGFSSRYIWLLWLSLGMIALATPANSFIDLFSKHDLHLDMTSIGHMNAYATLPSLLLMFPIGWLIDRFGPRVIWGVSSVAAGLIGLIAWFTVRDGPGMLYFYVFSGTINSVLGLTLLPMLYAHLPKNKFGQLVSAQSMVVQLFIFLSTNGIAHLIGSTGDNYRIALLYGAPFLVLVPLFLFLDRFVRNPFSGEAVAMQRIDSQG